MRRIAVINQKGGVGKTTTTVNLGAGFARLGRSTLICDLDPQCNLTVHLGLDPNTVEASLYELFHSRAELNAVARPTGQKGLSVAPASVDLAGLELELVHEVGREVILRDAFDRLDDDTYDFVLVDCPPSLGLLSLNALVACDELFVPIQAEFFALQGLGKLMDVVQLVRRRLNPNLRITGMVSCRHDPSTNLSKAVIADIKSHFGSIFQDTVIRRNVKLAEAPSHGKTIFEYDAECPGAVDYLALAQELLGQKDRAPETAAPSVAVDAPETVAETAPPSEPSAEAVVETPAAVEAETPAASDSTTKQTKTRDASGGTPETEK